MKEHNCEYRRPEENDDETNADDNMRKELSAWPGNRLSLACAYAYLDD
jgi:hypothetical protein